MALATAECSGMLRVETPASSRSIRMLPPPHQDRRHRLCARLHAVDRILHHDVDSVERTPHGRAVQPGDGLTVADIGEARRDGDVGGGERVAAEDQRLLG